MTEDISDDELNALGTRVRMAQRRNMLVRFAAVIIVVTGFCLGVWCNSLLDERGIQWAGLIGGLVAAGVLVNKFEVQVEEIE